MPLWRYTGSSQADQPALRRVWDPGAVKDVPAGDDVPTPGGWVTDSASEPGALPEEANEQQSARAAQEGSDV